MARTASNNLALFAPGELFNLGAIPITDGGVEGEGQGEDRVSAFSISRAVVLLMEATAMTELARIEQSFGEAPEPLPAA